MHHTVMIGACWYMQHGHHLRLLACQASWFPPPHRLLIFRP